MDLEGDFLREGIRLPAQLAIELEAGQVVGAGRYEGSSLRRTHRNGYRERLWETRVGEVPLRAPNLREGISLPGGLGPRRRWEKALVAVVGPAYVRGVSPRKVGALLQGLWKALSGPPLRGWWPLHRRWVR